MKAYVETGNVWDPEDEEELRRRLKLEDGTAEGGEHERKNLLIDIDDVDNDGKLPPPRFTD